MACANMGTPDGGPYDETPPKIVRTSPKFGDTKSSATKVVIEFDELVKIENAQEKVVVSPPQIEQPEIEAVGKKVTVTLIDSLKPNATYTIDFADAIVDNNEGNPFGDYAFTFSTGESIDTMQVSGNVLDASNLEPIKGMLVGLYRVSDDTNPDSVITLPDSTFHTIPFERISRTDSRGHFVIKGLARAKYRVFALDDKNQNYVYDQKSEMIALTDRVLDPSCGPDVRMDTLWHDSIHYISIDTIPYTHFYPDDIVLMAFNTAAQDRFKLKEERLEPQMFTLYFTAPSDTLPKLTGLNFDATDAFVVDATPKNDTITYWIRDSLIYNIDTLEVQLDYYATDSTGHLALSVDTMYLFSKLTKEKIAKQNKEKWDNWVKQVKQKAKEERRAAKRGEGKKEDENEQEKAAEGGKTPLDSIAANDSLGAKIPIDSIATIDSIGTIIPLDSIAAKDSLGSITPIVSIAAIDSIEIDTIDSVPTAEEDKASSPDEAAETSGTPKSSDKKKKSKKKDDDIDIEIPPMPEEFLEYKLSNASSLDPDKNIDFEFTEPLDSVDMSKIHFSLKVDSVFEPAKFIFKQLPGKVRNYRLYAEWEPDSTYEVKIDTGAFVNIYGKRCESSKRQVKVKGLDSYSTLFVVLHGADSSAVVQLLDASDKVVKSVKSKAGKADFYFINPGTFYMRLFYDKNGNGEWDTGDYDEGRAPEQVYYYPTSINLKAQWEITQDWTPTAIAVAKQKPAKITKQKPEKEKASMKSKNEERLRQKKEGNNGKNNNNSSSSGRNSNSF